MSTLLLKFIEKNGLVVAFLLVGATLYASAWLSARLTRHKLPTAAVAILIGLAAAYVGGVYTGGEKGLADVPVFAGLATMGGAMFRDFAIVSTAFGASFVVMRQTGWVGALSLLLGIGLSFLTGVGLGLLFGYHDAVSLATIGGGACTYIVGPVTGAALGASSDLIALSIAAGVVKAVVVAIGTPLVAPYVGLNTPQAAMAFGGLLGTNTGVMAGLAATDERLVPYGAMTATFYTGLGCLLCPSVLYLLLKLIWP